MTKIEASSSYQDIRNQLRVAELELRHNIERVAELRRRLPLDTVVTDYVFVDGDGSEVKLSELFTDPQHSLVIYHYMFGKAQTQACPMCTMWIDGFNAVAPHLEQRIDFAVVAAAPIDELCSLARARGWDNLRMLGAAGNTFKLDLGSENDDGGQESAISVFRLSDDGSVLHFYTGRPQLNDEHWRGIDLLTPVWNMFDLTPEGRGEWWPSLEYGKETSSG